MFETMTRNFPKLFSDTKPCRQSRTQRTPIRINAERATHRHIIFKLKKIKGKEKTLKETTGWWGDTLSIEEKKIRITSSFSETLQARSEQNQIKCWRKKNNQSIILCSLKLFFKTEGEIKLFLINQIEGICCQCTCLGRNIKISSLERRRIQVRNSDLIKKG